MNIYLVSFVFLGFLTSLQLSDFLRKALRKILDVPFLDKKRRKKGIQSMSKLQKGHEIFIGGLANFSFRLSSILCIFFALVNTTEMPGIYYFFSFPALNIVFFFTGLSLSVINWKIYLYFARVG